MSPSCSSRARAWRTVCRLMPHSSAISFSPASFWPFAYTPRRMSPFSRSNSCTYFAFSFIPVSFLCRIGSLLQSVLLQPGRQEQVPRAHSSLGYFHLLSHCSGSLKRCQGRKFPSFSPALSPGGSAAFLRPAKGSPPFIPPERRRSFDDTPDTPC